MLRGLLKKPRILTKPNTLTILNDPLKTFLNTVDNVVNSFLHLKNFSTTQVSRIKTVILDIQDSNSNSIGLVENEDDMPSINNIPNQTLKFFEGH